jgi:hypothetical protein
MDQIVESITPSSVSGNLTFVEKIPYSESNAIEQASIELVGASVG